MMINNQPAGEIFTNEDAIGQGGDVFAVCGKSISWKLLSDAGRML
jgi:hypothetical protein